jgi:hypothetical protein
MAMMNIHGLECLNAKQKNNHIFGFILFLGSIYTVYE